LGEDQVATPAIDRLAGSVGMTAVAGSPLCSPFRGSMLTSRYPHECIPGHDWPLPEGAPTIATALGEAGYRTAYYGKWHVNGHVEGVADAVSEKQAIPPARRGGFNLWLGYENNNAQWNVWLHGHDDRGREIERFKLNSYETDATTDLVTEDLKDLARRRTAGDETPFFTVVSVQPPHSPYQAPEQWEARHRPETIRLRPNVPPVERITREARRDLARYYAMIENLDWNVGRIVETLEQTGLLEDTYIVFFSDHGDMHGSHGLCLKCYPYEESIRVPFIVSRGGRPCGPARRRPVDTVINHVDIAATTMGLCGLKAPAWMRGHDYAAQIDPSLAETGRGSGETAPDSAFLQLVEPGFRYGFAPDRERPWRGVVTADGWKYAVLEGQPWVMFNLNEDPYELANLALDRRFVAQRQRLQDRLRAWMEATGDGDFRLPDIGGTTTVPSTRD
ncbi:MAG: sulfatase, partial [bacterium]|nr:sulfatase [bacterium]